MESCWGVIWVALCIKRFDWSNYLSDRAASPLGVLMVLMVLMYLVVADFSHLGV
jgi:hypothetical protein